LRDTLRPKEEAFRIGKRDAEAIRSPLMERWRTLSVWFSLVLNLQCIVVTELNNLIRPRVITELAIRVINGSWKS